jgi:5-methylcytosine-specific restriction endonuclease McrA
MKRVLDRDNWRCQKCGAVKDLQIHHQRHRSQLGNDSLENLVTLCAYCHMEEHEQLTYSKRAMREMGVRSTREVTCQIKRETTT